MLRVGENAYLACPKGQLVDGHILIIPVVHRQSTLKLPREAVEEMEKYKKALVKWSSRIEMMPRMFRAQGKSVLLWERNLTTRNPLHCHLQVVPIDPAKGTFGGFVLFRKRRENRFGRCGHAARIPLPGNSRSRDFWNSINRTKVWRISRERTIISTQKCGVRRRNRSGSGMW